MISFQYRPLGSSRIRPVEREPIPCSGRRAGADGTAERDAAIAESQKLRAELEDLRSERKTVRVRIEKLLGQMDQVV